LDSIRMGCGLGVLSLYAFLGTDLLALYGGADAWIDAAAAHAVDSRVWRHSLLFHMDSAWQFTAFFAVFFAATIAFTLGWRTRWVKWLVLVGHLSLLHRNPAISYGVDNILTSLLWILCLAPIGHSLSLDRWRSVRNAKRLDLAARPPLNAYGWACACLRLIQLQMVVFFFMAGATKLQGDSWWYGHALWYALTNYEYANLPVGWLVDQFWLVNLLTYLTIVLELAYPFLVWGPRRAWLLAEAIMLHLGIALLMGLYAFSFVMVFGHLAFVRQAWLQAWGAAWKARFGGMEMIYDGHCAFCKRSMAAFLAFDGLGQISVRDFRSNPSPIVPDAAMEKALHLVTPSGRAIAGFDAYRHAVLRVPGMWWMVPAFYIPVLSRAVGRPVYNWIATHRQVISTCGVQASTTAGAKP
jgi:predicted DCC family thiol-disulfide oxidoreductase YuxK